jgi:hypothetical protein
VQLAEKYKFTSGKSIRVLSDRRDGLLLIRELGGVNRYAKFGLISQEGCRSPYGGAF